MELTKEYFEEYFDKGLANHLEIVKETLDEKIKLAVAPLATKEELKSQTVELKQYTAEAFETQQVWMEERFNELIVKYDVRERVGKLEKDVAQLKLNHPAHV